MKDMNEWVNERRNEWNECISFFLLHVLIRFHFISRMSSFCILFSTRLYMNEWMICTFPFFHFTLCVSSFFHPIFHQIGYEWMNDWLTDWPDLTWPDLTDWLTDWMHECMSHEWLLLQYLSYNKTVCSSRTSLGITRLQENNWKASFSYPQVRNRSERLWVQVFSEAHLFSFCHLDA